VTGETRDKKVSRRELLAKAARFAAASCVAAAGYALVREKRVVYRSGNASGDQAPRRGYASPLDGGETGGGPPLCNGCGNFEGCVLPLALGARSKPEPSGSGECAAFVEPGPRPGRREAPGGRR
jgi:hypothetical protein